MKDFLVIANINAITYNDLFPLLKDGIVNLGYEKPKEYESPDGVIEKSGSYWYTTLKVIHKSLPLVKTYTPEKYPKYDNYPAIEVGRVKDIPTDYTEEMGVPITIFDYMLDGFVILGIAADKYGNEEWMIKGSPIYRYRHPPFVGMELNGKHKYARVLIRRKQL